MANTSAPFGFQHIGTSSGGAPTFANTRRLIASTDTNPVYFGDVVMPVVSSATGYITHGVAGTTVIAGIFVGCSYFSTSQQRQIWRNYWPGSDATGDVVAYVIDDAGAKFKVQAGATVVGVSIIGQYIQFAAGTGNTATGISGSYVQSPATTVTLPFIVLDTVTAPPGVNGTDNTTGYNFVIVGFNNEVLRSNGAGPTGIS